MILEYLPAALTVEKAVDAGAALLDEKNPGWASRVRLSVLDMNDYRYCVLGQLYGQYGIGQETLNLDPLLRSAPWTDGEYLAMHSFANHLYHDAWVQVIKARQDQLGKAV